MSSLRLLDAVRERVAKRSGAAAGGAARELPIDRNSAQT
jgi:hypothetical protein